MNLIKKWKKLPLKYRKEATSIAQTFIAVFGTSFFAQLPSGEMEWTGSLLASLAVASARAALKAAFNSYIGKR